MPMVEGFQDAVLYLVTASLSKKMRRWVEEPRLGLGFRLGRREQKPANASAWVRTERDQSLRTRRPETGAINSGQRTDVQQSEGISLGPLNGARRKKDLDTPAAGLPNGRRT